MPGWTSTAQRYFTDDDVHTFSCRLDGLRRYEKTLGAELSGGGR